MVTSVDSSTPVPAPAAGHVAPGGNGAEQRAGQADDSGPGRIDPLAMTVAQVSQVLSAMGNGSVTEDMIRRHVAAGAPTTAAGRINLVHYAAWLNKDMP